MQTLFRVSSIVLALVLVLMAGATAAPTGLVAADGPLACAAGATAPQKIKVGDVRPLRIDSPNPLPAQWETTVALPAAKFLRLHFVDFQFSPGDSLTISNPATGQAWSYTDRGASDDGDFWSFAINGETVKLEINAPSGTSRGFRITEVGYGTMDLDAPAITPSADFVPEVVCGDDGRQAIACQTNDAVVNAAQRPVARLLFTSGGAQYVCTGELIRGSNANTMITNAHCVDTSTEVKSVQAKFNYQYTTCGGTTLAVTTDYTGSTLLKTSAEVYRKQRAGSGLDYTLFTLSGNPEATWGELIPTTRTYAAGRQINFIQHPGGSPKKIGFWENAAGTVRCKIDTVNATYGSAAPASQAGYGCDSEGGSSGSAITDAFDGKVIALHHYGGVNNNPCLNSGTMMAKICANAGSLLSCDSN